MKIGILTFPNSISYGATLQMYALQSAVEKLGYDVEVINYYNSGMKAERHHIGKSHKRSRGKTLLKKIVHYPLYSSFKRFENRHINLYPKRHFTDKRELNDLGKRYHAVICGSDQVWNPDITDTDLSYFLNFCGNDTKRISYAPSFGREAFSEDFYEDIRGELVKFSAISVREKPGQAIVEDLVDRKVPIVSDPTFLIDRSDWISLEHKHPDATGEYILYYTVSRSDSLFRKCIELSEKSGLKVVVVGGNRLKNIKNKNPLIRYAVDVSPEEWLYLMHHARYVVTNSFHGTAFSIIFNKEFYVEYPPDTNSRLVQIIKAVGLENRVIRNGMDFNEEPISYEVAFDKVSEIRSESLRFLAEALK